MNVLLLYYWVPSSLLMLCMIDLYEFCNFVLVVPFVYTRILEVAISENMKFCTVAECDDAPIILVDNAMRHRNLD